MSPTTAIPPQPVVDVESKPFWDALREGRQVIPAEACRRCAAVTRYEPVAGTGVIYSYIVVHHAAVPGHAVPYVMALVDLDEQVGYRVPGIVAADPTEVGVGAKVVYRAVPSPADHIASAIWDLVP